MRKYYLKTNLCTSQKKKLNFHSSCNCFHVGKFGLSIGGLGGAIKQTAENNGKVVRTNVLHFRLQFSDIATINLAKGPGLAASKNEGGDVRRSNLRSF